MKRIFIINRASRNCPAGIGEAILRRFPDAALLYTQAPGDGSRLAVEALQISTGFTDVIAACGGDGTLREVAEAVGQRTTLGIVPLGTVNQISSQLSIPRNLSGALDVLEKGRTAKVYPALVRFDGEKTPHYTFIGVSAGPDANAVAGVNPKLKKRLGGLAYAAAFFQSLAGKVRPEISITVEVEGGSADYRASQAIVLANGLYGGAFRFSRTLTPASPGIELVWTPAGRFGVILFFLTSTLPLPFSGKTRSVEAGRVRLTLPSPGAFQLDGDKIRASSALVETTETPLYFRVGEAYEGAGA